MFDREGFILVGDSGNNRVQVKTLPWIWIWVFSKCFCPWKRAQRVKLHLWTSATSALPHLWTSSPLHLRTSAPLPLCTSAPLHLHTFAPPHLWTFAPLLLWTSTPLHLGTFAPLPLRTSRDLCLGISARRQLLRQLPELGLDGGTSEGDRRPGADARRRSRRLRQRKPQNPNHVNKSYFFFLVSTIRSLLHLYMFVSLYLPLDWVIDTF